MTEGILKDKVAVITGSARGMGKAIAWRMAEAGAKVVLCDLDLQEVRDTATEIAEKHDEAVAVKFDVTSEGSVNKMVNIALQGFGDLHILVNNAGIMHRTRFLDITYDEWKKEFDVNINGVFLATRAVIPIMKENGFGRIINISSSAGRSVSTLGGAHYTASKAAVLGLTRAVAKEMAPFGITVNAICPGLIDTKMARDTTTKEELEAFIGSFPIKRLGLPEEIGDLAVFLASERAAYITGASIDVNGGDLMI